MLYSDPYCINQVYNQKVNTIKSENRPLYDKPQPFNLHIKYGFIVARGSNTPTGHYDLFQYRGNKMEI